MSVCREQARRQTRPSAELDHPAHPQSMETLLDSHLITAGYHSVSRHTVRGWAARCGWHQALIGTRAGCSMTRGRQTPPRPGCAFAKRAGGQGGQPLLFLGAVGLAVVGNACPLWTLVLGGLHELAAVTQHQKTGIEQRMFFLISHLLCCQARSRHPGATPSLLLEGGVLQPLGKPGFTPLLLGMVAAQWDSPVSRETPCDSQMEQFSGPV